MTVGTFLDRFLDAVAHQVRPTTYRLYEYHVRVHLRPAFGRLRLAKLTATDVDAFLAGKLRAGMHPATVNRIRALASASTTCGTQPPARYSLKAPVCALSWKCSGTVP